MPPHAAQISERALLENRDFLRLLARKLVYDEHAAEDVVQQAWLAVLERPPRYRGPLRAWLAGVVRNLAFSTLKREGERSERESRAARAEAIHRDEAQDLEQQQLVMDSVHALRQPYRSTIYLRYYRELSPGEIAQLQGISVATVKTRLRRGLEQLRADLDHRHDRSRARWCTALAPFAGLGGIVPPSGALPVAGLLKSLILMNKTVLATLCVVVLSALASVAWYVTRPPEGGDLPPGISAPGVEPDGNEGLTGGAATDPAQADDESGAEKRTALAAEPAGPSAAGVAPPDEQLVGRVVNELGRPIEGAEVALFDSSSPWVPTFGLDPSAFDGMASTRTDREGRFALPQGEAGTGHLSVGADGFAPFRKEVTLGDPSASDVGECVLDPGVFLSGRVVDPGGAPVAGAEVRRPFRSAHGEMVVFGGHDPTPIVATTDRAGRFSIARQAVGPWKLRVQSEDHPPTEIEGQTDHPGERVADLLVTLAQGYEIAGQVIGLPADGDETLHVRAVPLREDDEGGLGLGTFASVGAPTAPVASDGRFRLRGLEGDCAYRLQLRAETLTFIRSSRSAAVDASPGDVGVTLVYSAPAALTFQVVDGESGQPLTDFEVLAGSSWLAPDIEDGKIKRHYPEGRVRIEDLRQSVGLSASELVRVQVHATGYESFERGEIAFAGNEEVDLGVVRLKRVPVVRVEVLDDRTREPVEGATVSLIPEGEVRDPSSVTMNVRIAATPGEEPVVYTEGSEQRTGVTDEHGICVLSSLPGEAAVIRVRNEDHAPYSSEVLDLPLTGDFDHRAELLEGSTAEVLVVDAEGHSLPGLRVQHEPPSGVPWSPERLQPGGGEPRRVSDSEGRILFARLEAGVHRFRLVEGPFAERFEPVSPGYGGPERGGDWQELVIAPGAEASLTLVAAPRGDLEGKITEAGLSLAGAMVRLLPAEEEPDGTPPPVGPVATTDSQGRYSLENVKADRYRLEITHESRVMPWVESLTIGAGRNEEDIDLPVTIIEGRITDAVGEPVAGALVSAERSRETEGGGQRRTVRMVAIAVDGDGGTMVSMTGPEQPEVRTDEEGYYQLRGVRNEWPLLVKVTGEGFAPERSETLELEDAETRRGVDLVVKPAGVIEVTLTRPDGTPASGFLARGSYLGEAESPVEPVVSFVGGDGKARLAGCLVGKWRVSFDPLTFPGQEQLEAPVAREVEVVAGETASVEATVD